MDVLMALLFVAVVGESSRARPASLPAMILAETLLRSSLVLGVMVGMVGDSVDCDCLVQVVISPLVWSFSVSESGPSSLWSSSVALVLDALPLLAFLGRGTRPMGRLTRCRTSILILLLLLLLVLVVVVAR